MPPGEGRVIMRAQAHTEELRGGQAAVIITEIPYQVNKSNLVERIATLVREDRLQGISDIRDESDRTGMRIVIELKARHRGDAGTQRPCSNTRSCRPPLASTCWLSSMASRACFRSSGCCSPTLTTAMR